VPDRYYKGTSSAAPTPGKATTTYTPPKRARTVTPPATATGGGSTSSAYEPAIVTGFKAAVNFVGGFANALTSEINGGMWTSAGGMAYMHISGNPAPQIPAIPIWGDYDTFKYSSWIGSTVGVMASVMLGGPGVAALSGRALATTSKAASKADDAAHALGQNGSHAARPAANLVPYSPEAASRNLVGQVGDGFATTPGGRTVSAHAADRIVNGAAGRAPTTLSRIDDILDNPTVKRYDPLRDTVRVSQGQAFVVVRGSGPVQHIVTVMVP